MLRAATILACACALLAACAAASAARAGQKKIDGTFMFPPNIARSQYKAFVDELQLLEMNTLIISSVRWVPYGTACSSADAFGWSLEIEDVRTLMDLSQAAGIDVWLGLVQATTGGDGCSMVYEDPLRTLVVDETRKLMASLDESGLLRHPTLRGFYIPDEPLLAIPFSTVEHKYYHDVAAVAHEWSALPVGVSPYLKGAWASSVAGMAEKARMFLNNTGVDIQMWQDSVGADNVGLHREPTSQQFYEAILKAIGPEHLWADIEAFNWAKNGLTNAGGYRSCSAQRLQEQINQVSPYVGRIVCWIQHEHFGTVDENRFAEAPRLMAAYRALTLGQLGWVKSASYSYAEGTQPDAKYPDAGSKKLFDGVTGNAEHPTTDDAWVGVIGPKVTLDIDLGREAEVQWVGVHVGSMPADGISLPERIALSASSDGGKTWVDGGAWDSPVTTSGISEYVLGNLEQTNVTGSLLRVTLSKNADADDWTFLSELEIVTSN